MLFFLIYLILFAEVYCSAEDVLVKVEKGLLRGEVLERSTGNGKYCSFKGVPYAAPPIGKLRFKAPEPPLPWQGIRCVKTFGSICPQLDMNTGKFIPGSEDCLFLNVYTPSINPKTPLAVMFYIPGGALVYGSADKYGPDFLLDHDVILVTINYRLGALGFLSLDIEEVPGNAGFKDQVAAMGWVKKNIAKFGGDPDNVTIFGQSSGGASVSLHVLSPLSRNLFKRAIALSQVFLVDSYLPFEHKRRALLFTQELGLYTNDPNEAFEFLQNATVKSLVETKAFVLYSERPRNDLYDLTIFTLVVEKDFGGQHFFAEDPVTILTKGETNTNNLILGHTTLEGTYRVVPNKDIFLKYYGNFEEIMVPLKIAYKIDSKTVLELADRIKNHYFGDEKVSNNTMKELITFYSYFNYIYDIHRYLEMWSKRGNNVYFYGFSAFTERNTGGIKGIKYGAKGSTHSDDLNYLFYGNNKSLTLNKNSASYKVIVELCTLYTNFAKFGNPTPDNSLGVTWLDYTNNNSYLDIGLQLQLKRVDTRQIDFWRSVFNSVGFIFS